MKLGEEFQTICETKEYIILDGRTITFLNIKVWSVSTLFDGNIPERKVSYLSGVDAHISYYHFNLTYFNKFICKQIFQKKQLYHYDDMDDEVF